MPYQIHMRKSDYPLQAAAEAAAIQRAKQCGMKSPTVSSVSSSDAQSTPTWLCTLPLPREGAGAPIYQFGFHPQLDIAQADLQAHPTSGTVRL